MTVVNAIADALDMTTERLYAAAGIPDEEEGSGVLAAIEADPLLRPAQRRALTETYRAFVVANGGSTTTPTRAPAWRSDVNDEQARRARLVRLR